MHALVNDCGGKAAKESVYSLLTVKLLKAY